MVSETDCRQECPGCPFIESLQVAKVVLDTQRQKMLGEALTAMASKAATDQFADATTVPGSMIEAVEAKKTVYERNHHGHLRRIERALKALDDRDNWLDDHIAGAPNGCANGPVWQKRFLIFGQQVVRCGSLYAAVSRQHPSWRYVTPPDGPVEA